MDIAAALGVTPAPSKPEPKAAPAAENDPGTDASSFDDEFESASAPASDTAEAAPAGTEETEPASDGAAPDNALLIDVEDLTVQTHDIAEPIVDVTQAAAEEIPAAEIEEPAIGVDAASETPVEATAALVIEAAVEPDVSEMDEPPAEAPIADDDGAAIAADAAVAPAAPVSAPAVVQTSVPVEDAAESNAAPAEIKALAETEEAPAELPVIREAREKPYMSHGADRLAAYWHNMRQDSADSPAAALRASSLEAVSTANVKAQSHTPIVQADSAAVAEQVTAAIRADRGAGSIDVRLDPPELGRVRIQFNMERADVVVATVSSERGETLDLLRRHATDLVRELERAGFASVQLDFTGGKDGSFEGWEQPESGGYDVLPDAMAEEQIVAFTRQPQGRLDRFV